MTRFITFLLLFCSASLLFAAPPRVVFVTGDHEYSSERTMPLLAQALEKQFGLRTTVLYATEPNGHHTESYEKNIPGLGALKTADLAVFFLRWRQLPKEQIDMIQAYLDSGKPLLGFRTDSHAFNYPKGDPLEHWNAFGEFAFGTPPGWGAHGHTHYGHLSSTDVSMIDSAAANPILNGVEKSFHVRSWLYRMLPDYPAPSATPLLMGVSVNPDKESVPNPVAWTFQTKQRARAFYTSMGHPEDFQVESFQRLVVNAVFWCLQKPEPLWPGKLPIDVSYEKPPPPFELRDGGF